MALTALGWNARRQAEFARYAADRLIPGRVVVEHRSHFQVATESIELPAVMTGRLRNAALERSDLAGVGDFVALRPSMGGGPATIEAVLPRTTALVRKASSEQRPQLLVANVDVVFLVTTPDRDFNLPRIERYLALIGASGAAPVIVLNKADLAGDVVGTTAEIAAIAPAVPIHAISAREPDCVRYLDPYFRGNQTVGLIGSSGVGKSTLTNQLLGRSAQATQDVRTHDRRGRHTTTHRQLFVRPQGGAIIDTPGMRGVEAWNDAKADEQDFDDIESLATQCKFRNCRHVSEPGCEVRAAVARGDLEAGRLTSYAKLDRPLRAGPP